MKGNTKSQYYKIIVYLGDKGKKKQRGFKGQPLLMPTILLDLTAMNIGTCLGCQMQFQQGGQMSNGPCDAADSKGLYFIEEQYKRLVNLLNKDAEERQANMTGKITCLSQEFLLESGLLTLEQHIIFHQV